MLTMGMSQKQISFDLSQKTLEVHYPRGEWAQSELHYRKAYQGIRKFKEKQGFAWRKNSVYVSEAPMITMDTVLVSQRMAETLPWMRPCVKEIMATDIGAQYSLLGLLRSDTPPAELLPIVSKVPHKKENAPERWVPPDKGIYDLGSSPGRNHAEISCRGLFSSCGMSPPIKPMSL